MRKLRRPPEIGRCAICKKETANGYRVPDGQPAGHGVSPITCPNCCINSDHCLAKFTRGERLEK